MIAGAEPLTLHIAVSEGAAPFELAALLAQQRSDEPDVRVVLHAATLTQQQQGLRDGVYDVGLALVHGEERGLVAKPLWRDELAIALPEHSPLLTYRTVPLAKALRHPLIMWHPEACEELDQQLAQLLRNSNITPTIAGQVKTFELMIALVSAGYGIGFAGRSRIVAARPMNVVMRPLAGVTARLTTHIVSALTRPSCATDRFITRALALTHA